MVYVGERAWIDRERWMLAVVAYCGGDSGRGEPGVLDARVSNMGDLTTGKVSVTRGPGAEPGGRFPGSSIETMHVRGWLGSDVRVIVGNSERTWMDGATT